MINKNYLYTLVQNNPIKPGTQQEYRNWVFISGRHLDYRDTHEIVVLQTNTRPSERTNIPDIDDYLSKLEDTQIIDVGFVSGSHFHEILQGHGKIMSDEVLTKVGIADTKNTEEYKRKKERLKTLKTLNRRTWDTTLSPSPTTKQDPRFNPKHYPELY